MNDVLSKIELRSKLRKQRAKLSHAELIIAEQGIAYHASKSMRLLQAKRIASYAPFAGEASPDLLLKRLRYTSVFLPKIVNFHLKKMAFYPASNHSHANKYGIDEPHTGAKQVFCNRFDVILLPLLAFDRTGTRMGMGAGYYDRALQALTHQTSTKPYLIGIAHHFQEVTKIKRESWDIPLDAILTDHEFIHL